MENLVGVEDANDIDIIANGVEIREDGSWTIVFRHPERSVPIPFLGVRRSFETQVRCRDVVVSDMTSRRVRDLTES